MSAEVVQLRPRPTCAVCGGGMSCEFCPVPVDEQLRREDRLVVGREVVLEVKDGRVFLHLRARR